MDAAQLAERAAALAGASRWQELLAFLDAQLPGAERMVSTDIAYRVGEALYHLGRMAELAEHAAAFEAVARRSRDVGGILRALNLRGIAAFELGDIGDARDAFESLMALAEAEQNLDMLARASLNLGAVANLHGEPESAIILYQLAVPLFQKLGQVRGLGQVHQSLAMSYRDLGRMDDADDAYREAMRLGLEHGYPPIVAMASIGRAELRVIDGDPAAALGLAEWGLGLARRLGDPITEGTGLRVRAWAHAELGRHEEADTDFDAALRLARHASNRLLEAETLRDLGRLALRSGDREAARHHWEAAVDLFRRLGSDAATGALARQVAVLDDEAEPA